MAYFHHIALLANAQISFLMLDVVRELKKRHGSVVHLYCWTPQELEFYRNRNSDGALSSVNMAPTLPNLAVEPVSDFMREVSLARKQEREIGRTYASLSVANRHLGRGYALGGFYHPRSRQAIESTYEGVVQAYNRFFAYWDQEVSNKRLTMFLGGSAEIPVVARKHGIPYRKLAGSRHRNYHFWTHNEYNESNQLAEAYSEFESKEFEPVSLDEPYKLVGTTERHFERAMRLDSLIKMLSYHWLRRAYWRLRGYEKARGYLASDEARMIFRRWRYGRRLAGSNMARLSDLRDTPFIFFPLATEPEVALQQFSPEFFFQHTAIAALSRDLPAGVKLVVKESSVGVGRRPDNFYEQISELKNVIWMDIHEPGFAVAKEAHAVAVITGSTGFEAAIVGTPVISFGVHNLYNMLPHVFPVTDLARLGETVRRIFEDGVNPSEAAAAGARYLQAVVDTSFDLGVYDYVDLRSYDQDVVRRACDALEDSLNRGAETRGSVARAG